MRSVMRLRLLPTIAALAVVTASLPSIALSLTLNFFGPAAAGIVSGVLSSAGPAWPGRELKKEDKAEGILMEYSWRTPDGRPLALSFLISRTDLEESEKAFGYVRAELKADLLTLEASLKQKEDMTPMAIARRLIRQSRYSKFIEAHEGEGGEIELKVDENRPLPPGIGAEVERLGKQLESTWGPCKKKISTALQKRMGIYLAERGLIRNDRGFGVRYEMLIRRSIPLMKPVAKEIMTMSSRCFDGRDLDALLSFVQQIPSQPVPEEDNGRYTAGCRVPLRVLADDGGDCDSKAVLFAALWESVHNYPLVLVSVPDHMLVGVTGCRSDGAHVVLDSIRYVLCEVCTRVPAPPGVISRYAATCINRGQVRYTILDKTFGSR